MTTLKISKADEIIREAIRAREFTGEETLSFGVELIELWLEWRRMDEKIKRHP